MARAGISRRPPLAIDEDHVVALAVPSSFDVINRQEKARESSLALCVQDKIVVVPGKIFVFFLVLNRILMDPFRSPRLHHAPPLCMKSSRVRRQLTWSILFILDVVVQIEIFHPAVVFNSDPSTMLKGHRKVRDQPVEISAAIARIDVDWQGMERP